MRSRSIWPMATASVPRRAASPSASCAALFLRCTMPDMRSRRSRGDWRRCAASFALASARAGPNRIRPRHCGTRARATSCRTFFRRTKSASCLPLRKGNSPQAVRDRAILETLYSAGLRVSELVGMCDGDLDFAAGIARVRGKGPPRAARPDRLLRRPGTAALAGSAQAFAARKDRPRGAGLRQSLGHAADHTAASPACWKST